MITLRNTRSLFTLAITLLMAGAVLFATLDSAYAATATPTGNPARSGDLITKTAQGDTITCSDYGVLLGAMVPCIMFTVENTGVKFAEEFRALMTPAFFAFLTLTVIFFGVKIMEGEGQVGPKAVLFIIKFAFVIGFLWLMPGMIPYVHSAMRETSMLLSNMLVDPNNFSCDVSKYLKPNGELLWAQMDCVLGKLFGFIVSDGSTQPNMLLAASGLGLIGGFVFSGTVGVFVFFAILGVLWSLLSLVMKAFLAYVNGFIVATILIIIAPIFLPLSIMQVTAQYFDKWWKGILAAMLMPVLITGYVVLALMLYDKVLLRDDSVLNKIFDPAFMQELQVMTEQACGGATGNSRNASIMMDGRSASDVVVDPNFRDRINQTASGNSALCMEHPSIRMAADKLEELFINLVILFITTMVITQGFKVIQDSVRNITGSSMVSTATDAVSSMEKKTDAALQSARQQAMSAAGDKRGADFLSSVPDVVRSSVGGFIQQVQSREGH